MLKDDNGCWAASCHKTFTHTLKMRVLPTGDMPEWESEIGYCLEHALYFAAWLPYCYPGEQELISIMPPASELFSK
jgi:hypothetical protein